jgi:hypothetical protein
LHSYAPALKLFRLTERLQFSIGSYKVTAIITVEVIY